MSSVSNRSAREVARQETGTVHGFEAEWYASRQYDDEVTAGDVARYGTNHLPEGWHAIDPGAFSTQLMPKYRCVEQEAEQMQNADEVLRRVLTPTSQRRDAVFALARRYEHTSDPAHRASLRAQMVELDAEIDQDRVVQEQLVTAVAARLAEELRGLGPIELKKLLRAVRTTRNSRGEITGVERIGILPRLEELKASVGSALLMPRFKVSTSTQAKLDELRAQWVNGRIGYRTYVRNYERIFASEARRLPNPVLKAIEAAEHRVHLHEVAVQRQMDASKTPEHRRSRRSRPQRTESKSPEDRKAQGNRRLNRSRRPGSVGAVKVTATPAKAASSRRPSGRRPRRIHATAAR